MRTEDGARCRRLGCFLTTGPHRKAQRMLDILRGRRSLLWLLAPAILFVAPLPLVNRPHLLGPWLLGATLLTPLFIYLAARRDPLFTEPAAAEDDAE